jgi:hypothetical protein
MTETEKILIDALSLKLFGRNVNPNPSFAWVFSATEEELAEWQLGNQEEIEILAERIMVKKQVDSFTEHEAEELEGIRHFVPPLEEDLSVFRQIPIQHFTRQPVKKLGSKFFVSCVFHNDKHPSCALYGEKGFYCFSCGAAGNSVDWAIKEYGYTFTQAVDFLRYYTSLLQVN